MYVRAVQPSWITEHHSQDPQQFSVANTTTCYSPRASPTVFLVFVERVAVLDSWYCTSVGSTVQHATSNMTYIYELQDEELFVFKNQEHHVGNCKHRSCPPLELLIMRTKLACNK